MSPTVQRGGPQFGDWGNVLRRWKRVFEEEFSGERVSADKREELKRLLDVTMVVRSSIG